MAVFLQRPPAILINTFQFAKSASTDPPIHRWYLENGRRIPPPRRPTSKSLVAKRNYWASEKVVCYDCNICQVVHPPRRRLRRYRCLLVPTMP